MQIVGLRKIVRPRGAVREKGFTSLLGAAQVPEVGLSFGVCKIPAGASYTFGSEEMETAVVAFEGKGELTCGGRSLPFERSDWITTAATVVHCSSGDCIQGQNTGTDLLEVFVVQTPNSQSFVPRFYSSEDVQIEHRGKGILQDTCYRIVRLVFDDSNGPPESQLVLGEVVNFPGRWSSYPPHFHPQPEIYYYRFHPAQGYGHGELGKQVFKIEDGDLLAITSSRVHAQVSAPGYHMYYLWAIRHLDNSRYQGFTFDPAHAWILEETAPS